MTRKKAFYIHSLLSGFIILVLLSVALLLWYPFPFSVVNGVWRELLIISGSFFVVGPFLTLILFKPGKAGLKLDMIVVSIIQSAVILYGSYTLYLERPYYAVFVVDRFEVVSEKDIDQTRIVDQALRAKPWGQLVFVVASLPVDVAERQRIMQEALFEGKPDIDRRPEYWSSLAQNPEKVSKAVRAMSDLLERRPDKAAEIYRVINESDGGEQSVYAPVVGKRRVFALVLDPLTFQPVTIIDVDPWARPVDPTG